MPSNNNDDASCSENDFYAEKSRGKKKKRVFFPTKLGSYCINAVTGIAYPYKQGSFEELRLYKITDVTTSCDANGYKRARTDPLYDSPHFLYYDSPEQYSHHAKMVVSHDKINKWRSRVDKMFPGGSFSHEQFTHFVEVDRVERMARDALR